MQIVVAFVRLARLKFLVGGFAGYALGVTVAAYQGVVVTPAAYSWGQCIVTAFQLMTHFANEYFDRHADRYTRPTEFAGGSGVLAAGLLTPRVAIVAAAVCAGCGTLALVRFAVAGNAGVAALGLAIGLLSWGYSAPPFRLAAQGWGEIDTAAIVGVLVPLAGYAAVAGRLDVLILSATLAPAAAMFAMMIAVEWPDRSADRLTGKRNLVVRFGTLRTARLATVAAVLLVPAFVAPLAFGAPRSVLPFALLIAPVASGFAGRIRDAGALAAEVAAHGVTLFFLTVTFSVFGYISSLH